MTERFSIETELRNLDNDPHRAVEAYLVVFKRAISLHRLSPRDAEPLIEEQRVRQETWRRSVRETCESILMREGQRVN